jgi:hypothetical protein
VVEDSLNNAEKNDVSYRSGLPIGYQHLGGLCESEKSQPHSAQRQLFENQVNNLIKKLKNYNNLDHAIDKFSLQNFYTNSLPPSINDGKLVY